MVAVLQEDGDDIQLMDFFPKDAGGKASRGKFVRSAGIAVPKYPGLQPSKETSRIQISLVLYSNRFTVIFNLQF